MASFSGKRCIHALLLAIDTAVERQNYFNSSFSPSACAIFAMVAVVTSLFASTRAMGRLYVGRHEALISKETFLKVQEILDQRNREGDRDIVHFHFLKGVLYCGECKQAGRRSRLLYSQNTGNGGMYEYFICTAHQRRLCSTPAIRVEQLEALVVRAVAAEQYERDAIDDMSALITSSVHDLLAADRDVKAQLRIQLSKLEMQEERLIDLAASGAVAVP
ncbi:MAG: recombinase zinc beta ribbon domain-containing protein [Rhodoglobus sp.]